MIEKKKIIKDMKFYKKKLDNTIQNISVFISFILIGWLVYKVSKVDNIFISDSGLIILLVVVGILALWFVFMFIIEIIIKLLAFGKTLK